MKNLNKDMAKKVSRPIAVMQYGEGNFLRAFVDYMIEIANEKGVTDMGIAIVKPITFGSLAVSYTHLIPSRVRRLLSPRRRHIRSSFR